MKKAIIFDASSLISLGMNGLFEEIKKLKDIFKGSFLITNQVKKEIIDKPINIKKFELEALRFNKLLKENYLELPISLKIDDYIIIEKTRKLLEIANKTFISNKKEIHILDDGEVSCLALSEILNERRIENLIAVDERTLRFLVENPENLKSILKEKLHTKIDSIEQNYKFFKNFKIIRSSELVYIMCKKELVKLNGQEKILDALLYAVKYKGCAISNEEIENIKKL